MEESGVKAKTIAIKAEVPVSRISAMKRGYLVDAVSFGCICDTAGLSADYLIGMKEENSPVAKMDARKRKRVIAERVKILVEKDAEKITTICENCGLYAGCLTKYINGSVKPRVESLLNIAAYYNVSLDWLLGLSEEEQS